MTTSRSTTKPHQRHVEHEGPGRGWQGIRAAFGRAVHYAAAVVRFALIWFGAYLGVAAILLIGWAFST